MSSQAHVTEADTLPASLHYGLGPKYSACCGSNLTHFYISALTHSVFDSQSAEAERAPIGTTLVR
jgi:hypothetical protein